MIASNRWIFALSGLLIVLVSLPLYFLGLIQEGLLVASMVILYLFIAMQLDFFIRVAKALKWTKTAVILVGFFGIKNIFFGFFFLLVYFAGWVEQSWTAFLLPGIYLMYSVVIAKKLLDLNPEDFKSTS